MPDGLFHSAAEITYHVRSALDQMLVAIAVANGQADVSRVQFPFAKDKATFEGRETQAKIKVLPDMVRALVYNLKPWEIQGNQDLWGLGQLANIDKHRTLIPFGALHNSMELSSITVDGGGYPGSVGIIMESGSLFSGVTISRIGPNGKFEIRPDGRILVGYTISFSDEVAVFAKQCAYFTLRRLTDLTKTIVESFSSQCF